MKTICTSFYFELSEKLKQTNLIFLIIPNVKREALAIYFTISHTNRSNLKPK